MSQDRRKSTGKVSGSPSRIPVASPHGNKELFYDDNVQDNAYLEDSPRHSGVRYITEELIRKVSQEEYLDAITKLNLTLSREGGKKIKYIENLDKLRNLMVLNLGCNMIEKIEHMDRLVKLREVNLSFNCIERMEGLETLTSLQHLNLTGNRITTVAGWLPKKLKALQVVRLAKNRIESLHEVSKLWSLSDLSQLSVSENPLTRLAHHRHYIVFHLRTLEILDGQAVEAGEREAAKQRFAQDEIQRLKQTLDDRERQLADLQERHAKMETDSRIRDDRERDLHRKQRKDIERINELEKELKTKDELLKKKTEELTRACHKHYELEQDLAFHKIDAKFDTLGKPPLYNRDYQDDDDQGTGESPYIGKGRYTNTQIAQLRAARGAMTGSGGDTLDSGTEVTLPLSPPTREWEEEDRARMEMRQQLEQALDSQLRDKQEAVNRAQNNLENLQGELKSVEQRVLETTLELNRVANATPLVGLNAEERTEMREKLSRKIALVGQLRQEADLLREQMDATEEDMQEQVREVDDLRHQLDRLADVDDPLYRELHREMVDKEQQVAENNRLYQELQQQLDDLLDTIKHETEEIRELERRLSEGQAEQNEQIKDELEGIIGGLTDYLNTVKKQAAEQQDQHREVLREKAELERRLAEAESELAALDAELEESQDAQSRLVNAEKGLEDEKQMNAQLARRLKRGGDGKVEELEKQLVSTEQEAANLKKALRRMKRRAQDDLDDLKAELKVEQVRNKDLSRRSSNEEALRRQLAAMEAANRELQNRLFEQKRQQMLQEHAQPGRPVDEVEKKTREIMASIAAGKGVPTGTDPISRSLGNLVRTAQETALRRDRTQSQSQWTQSREEARPSNRPASVPARVSPCDVERGDQPNTMSTQTREESIASRPSVRSGVVVRETRDESASSRPSVRSGVVVGPMPLLGGPLSPSYAADERVLPANSYFSLLEESKKTYQQEMGQMKNQIGRLQSTLDGIRAKPKIGLKKKDDRKIEDDDGGNHELLTPEEEGTVTPPRTGVRVGSGAQRRGSGDLDSVDGEERVEGHRETVDRKRKIQSPGSGRGRSPAAASPGGDQRPRSRPHSRGQVNNSAAEDPMSRHVHYGANGGPPETLSSDEQGMFEELHSELLNLRSQLDNTETTNAKKLEDAAAQITNLERELRRRDTDARETETRKYRQNDRRHYEQQLDTTMNELENCQGTILELQSRLDQREVQLENDRLVHQRNEVDQLKDVMEAQRAEILRLNDILDRMTGLNPAEVNPYEVHQLYQDIGSLSQRIADPGQPSVDTSGLQAAYTQTALPMSRQSPMRAATTSIPGPRQNYPGLPAMPNVYQQPFGMGGLTHSLSTPALTRLPPPPAYPQQLSASHGHSTSEMHTTHHIRRHRSGEEGGSLYCNVPEHHDLEDILQTLQERNRKLRHKLKEKRHYENDEQLETIRQLRDEIEIRKDELEGLELDIERRRVTVDRLVESERQLDREREELLHETDRLRRDADRISQRREALATDEVEGELEAESSSLRARHQYLREEMACLEESLAKRRAELTHTEKLLSQAHADLQEVKDQARETIRRFDEARLGYDRTVKEAEELDKRAREAGLELVKATNDTHGLRAEVSELENMKRDLEQTLNDIQQVIVAKDAEYQDLEQRVKQAAESLYKLQQEVSLTSEQERERLNLIQEGDQMLADKRTELDRLRQQAESERCNLENVDREMGKRRTEFELLEEEVSKRREELSRVVRETERETATRQREVREVQSELDSLTEEKKQLLKMMEDLKGERDQHRETVEREQQTLQGLTASAGKCKSELQHLTELVKLEQAGLARVKEQYEERVAEIDRTQAALHDQNAELAQVDAQRKRKLVELDRLRESVSQEQASLELLSGEKRGVESSLGLMNKEREMLSDTNRTLEAKIASMKKQHSQLEETLFSAQSRLDKISCDAETTSATVEAQKGERDALRRQVQQLGQQMQQANAELKAVRDRIAEYEGLSERTETEMRSKLRSRDEVTAEVRRLGEQVRACQLAAEEAMDRQTSVQEAAHRAETELGDRRLQVAQAGKNLARLKKDIEKEESRLSQLLHETNLELNNVKADLMLKRDELDTAMHKLNQIKREMEHKQHTEEKLGDLERLVKEQETELSASSDDKSQLSQALNRSYKELQALREEFSHERDSRQTVVRSLEAELEAARREAADAQREARRARRRSTRELSQLERTAEEQCQRANRLAEDLNQARHDYLLLRKQVVSQEELVERERRLQETLRSVKADLSGDVSRNVGQIEVSHQAAFGELAQMHGQRSQLQAHLDALKENLASIRGSEDCEKQVSSSSGLGGSGSTPSTGLPPPGYSQELLDQETQAFKRELQDRMRSHRAFMEEEHRRSDDALRTLKDRLSTLRDLDHSPPETLRAASNPDRARSPFRQLNKSSDPPSAPIQHSRESPTTISSRATLKNLLCNGRPGSNCRSRDDSLSPVRCPDQKNL